MALYDLHELSEIRLPSFVTPDPLAISPPDAGQRLVFEVHAPVFRNAAFKRFAARIMRPKAFNDFTDLLRRPEKQTMAQRR